MISRLHRFWNSAAFLVCSFTVMFTVVLALNCSENEEAVSPCVDEGISEIQVAEITSTTVVIHWKTETASTSAVRYQPWLGDEWAWTAEDETMTTEHEVTIIHLLPNTTYYYALAGRASPDSPLCQTYIGNPFETLP